MATMFADTTGHVRRFEEASRSRRLVQPATAPLRVAGLVVVAAALASAAAPSAAPATAPPAPPGATIFTHSAKGGELRGGRLILRGVSRHVSWVTVGGHAGVLAVRHLHRRHFTPGAAATGTLHVAGHRGGDEPAFRLSRPRYIASRRTVSYRARPLNNRTLPGRGGRAARAAGGVQSEFGAASLSMVGTAQVAAPVGNYVCATRFENDIPGMTLEFEGALKVPEDDWNPAPGGSVASGGNAYWASSGTPPSDGSSPPAGTVRCKNAAAWRLASNPEVEFVFTTLRGAKSEAPTGDCYSTNTSFTCRQVSTSDGVITWKLVRAG